MNDQTLDTLFAASDALRTTEQLLVLILQENAIHEADSVRRQIDKIRAHTALVDEFIREAEKTIKQP